MSQFVLELVVLAQGLPNRSSAQVQCYQPLLHFLGQWIKLDNALHTGNRLIPGLPLFSQGCQALQRSKVGLPHLAPLEPQPFLEQGRIGNDEALQQRAMIQ